VESLLLLRLTPPVAPVRERRSATAPAGDAIIFLSRHRELRITSEPDVSMQERTDVIRNSAKQSRNALSEHQREIGSEKICAAVIRTTLFQQAKTIACYLPMNSEVDCRILIKCAWSLKKRVFVPIVKKTSELHFAEIRPDNPTRPNKFGIEEPVGTENIDARELELVFTPLVAFDLLCNRIGMGGGYYDRAFSFLNEQPHTPQPKLIGLAFSCQQVPHIGASTWDIPLFRVITEVDADI